MNRDQKFFLIGFLTNSMRDVDTHTNYYIKNIVDELLDDVRKVDNK